MCLKCPSLGGSSSGKAVVHPLTRSLSIHPQSISNPREWIIIIATLSHHSHNSSSHGITTCMWTNVCQINILHSVTHSADRGNLFSPRLLYTSRGNSRLLSSYRSIHPTQKCCTQDAAAAAAAHENLTATKRCSESVHGIRLSSKEAADTLHKTLGNVMRCCARVYVEEPKEKGRMKQ